MPKKKEAGKSTGNGKGKGKASSKPSSTQAQSARDIGSTFSGADDDDAGSDLTVEGIYMWHVFLTVCLPSVCGTRQTKRTHTRRTQHAHV